MTRKKKIEIPEPTQQVVYVPVKLVDEDSSEMWEAYADTLGDAGLACGEELARSYAAGLRMTGR